MHDLMTSTSRIALSPHMVGPARVHIIQAEESVRGLLETVIQNQCAPKCHGVAYLKYYPFLLIPKTLIF